MSDRTIDDSALARRYGRKAADEWQRLLNHFALGDGFALLVLIVPDRDGARLCRIELTRLLRNRRKSLERREPSSPDALQALATTLLDDTLPRNTGAMWVAAVVQPGAAEFPAWQAAWRAVLEGLNQQRNTLRRAFGYPLVIVAPPWVVPVFREVAPDLWSVRSQVIRIEPDRDAARGSPDAPRDSAARREAPVQPDAPDPELALREAERLRGLPGRERELARLLHRAGIGLIGHGDPRGAEAVLREAAELRERTGEIVQRGVTQHELGRALLDQGRAAEAEAAFRAAVALMEAGGARPDWRGRILQFLGSALLAQGRAADAEAVLREALALMQDGGAKTASRIITLEALAQSILDQGRAAEAEAMFLQSSKLDEADSDAAARRQRHS